MIRIYNNQMVLFKMAAVRAFEDSTLAHLAPLFPAHLAIFGEDVVRDVIRLGLERAFSYTISDQGGVRLYISLMLMLGSHFDRDPQYSWAKAILDEPISGHERACKLYDKVVDYQQKVAKDGGHSFYEALDRLLALRFEDLQKPFDGAMEPALIALFERLFPDKCASLGRDALLELIRHSRQAAGRYGMLSPAGLTVYTGMAFMLGSGFDEDPQFVWAAQILNQQDLVQPDQRARALYDEAMRYLKRRISAARGDS